MIWEFDNIPKEAWDEIEESYKNNDIDTLVYLHNKYNLSNYSYCCGNTDGILTWFKYGIDNRSK